jgi:hypothetical protein
VNGPIASGSQLWVEFGYPARKDWAKYDCRTRETPAGESLQVSECLASDRMTTPYVGPVDFSIHLRNELQGTTVTLFTGKAKVAKAIGIPQALIDSQSRSSFESSANAATAKADRLNKEANDLSDQADKLQKDHPDIFKK